MRKPKPRATPPTQPILTVRHLKKHFGGITAVNDAHFDVAEHSITGLIGPNGAGKTTVFSLLMGFLKPDAGELRLRGQSIARLATHRRAQRGMSQTFQSIRLFPELTVNENLKVAFKETREGFWQSFLPQRRHERALDQKAHNLLKLAHLDAKAHLKAGELSYGQQKLLEILRAVATEADLILLDEPAAGVNRTLLRTIEHLIRTLQKQGKTFLIIEHDMTFIMGLCDKVIVMDYGKVIAEGKPREIQKNPKVLEAYLGTPA